jgi:fructose-1-phosphate kinase PfkB-like protein
LVFSVVLPVKNVNQVCQRLEFRLTVVRTQTETRANLELVSADGVVTEILEPGGAVTEGEVERLLVSCRDIFAESDRGTQVALSGSLPPGAPSDLYAQLIRLAHLMDVELCLIPVARRYARDSLPVLTL